MCNHYRNDPEAMEGLQTWQEYISWDLPREAVTDVWPRKQGLVITAEGPYAMQWGVPLKMKGKREGSTITKRITNVRNLQSPFWRSMLNNPAQRCLVAFSEFAEPVIGKGREEHWFSLPSRSVAAFAGIWRESEEGKAYAFLTCEPNPLVKPLHPKAMPVILDESDYKGWLSGYDAKELAKPYPSQLMTVGGK